MTDSTADTTAAGAGEAKPLGKRLLRGLLSLVVLGFIFWFVFRQFGDAADVWAAIKTLTRGDVVLLVIVTAWNLFTYWLVTVAVTPGLRLPQAAVLNQSTTAVSNCVPAGAAVALGLTYRILGSWGFSKSRATMSLVVSGIWNQFVKLGTPILALAIVAMQGNPGVGQLTLALVGLAILVAAITVFALILRSDQTAAGIGNGSARVASKVRRMIGRGPAEGWDHAVIKFRHRIIGLVRHRWAWITAATMVSHASLYLVLLTSLRVMGVSDDEIGWAQVLVIYAIARLSAAIPLTPGGVGVIELVLIAGLTSIGGVDVEVVAGVFLYRFLTWLVPIPLGGLTYLWWRRNQSWRDSAPPLPAALDAAPL